MAYESFYGGRRGESFVIVKRYLTIEEMTSEFKQGGMTTDEVNYGEYVIIDTENKNNLTNGCVYRREMDYSTTIDNNNKYEPGAGAKYIGQIVGPDGKVGSFLIGDFDELAQTGEYTPSQMVSGATTNVIKYSYENVKDENGNITGYKIGFKFPYYVVDFEGAKVDPYFNGDIVEDDTGSEISERPFYRKQKLNVPQGYKGDSIKDLMPYPTYIEQGTIICSNANPETGELSGGSVLEENITIVPIEFEKTGPLGYVKFKYNNSIRFAFVKDCIKQRLGYNSIDYTETEEGEATWTDAGAYKAIDSISIEANDDYETPGSQKVQVAQNDGTVESIGEPLNYIMRMALDKSATNLTDEEDRLLVLFSDENKRGDITYDGIEGQKNLGNVRVPVEGGIPSIGNFTSASELTNERPPEVIMGDERYRGQVATVKSSRESQEESSEIQAYDYTVDPASTQCWYYVGQLATQAAKPREILVVSSSAPTTLVDYGYWGVLESVKHHS